MKIESHSNCSAICHYVKYSQDAPSVWLIIRSVLNEPSQYPMFKKMQI